jgi:hypothetical protein
MLEHYSSALRCVGQALQKRNIEVFDLKCEDETFLLQCGDPSPPYFSLIELRYSLDNLIAIEREARARRRDSLKTVQFEGLPEMLRAVGRYVDRRRARLLRIWNSDTSDSGDAIKVEYRTRDRNLHSEEFSASSIYEHSVRMYKERRAQNAKTG